MRQPIARFVKFDNNYIKKIILIFKYIVMSINNI